MDIDAENTTNNGYRKEKRVKEVERDGRVRDKEVDRVRVRRNE